MMLRIGTVAILLILPAGCPLAGQKVKPHDMSKADHELAQQEHESLAETHESKADPHLVIVESGIGESRAVGLNGVSLYNPEERHRILADRHMLHAGAHAAAAAELQAFEDQQCVGIEPARRAKCPPLGTIERIHNAPEGVRMVLFQSEDADAVEAHVRCHLAHARSHYREGMDACPLYLDDVKVNREGSRILHVRVDAPHVQELRTRVMTHVARADAAAGQ